MTVGSHWFDLKNYFKFNKGFKLYPPSGCHYVAGLNAVRCVGNVNLANAKRFENRPQDSLIRGNRNGEPVTYILKWPIIYCGLIVFINCL
jgi:hypothetical protein